MLSLFFVVALLGLHVAGGPLPPLERLKRGDILQGEARWAFQNHTAGACGKVHGDNDHIVYVLPDC